MMRVKSTIKPAKFKLYEKKGNLIEVTFFDDINEMSDENNNKVYEYSEYGLKIVYRENLEEYINDNHEAYLNLAKETDYQLEANKVREKRNKLLAESDEFLLLDRLNIKLPNEITTVTLLSSIKEFFDNLKTVLNGEWAEYRQKLRDIPEQEGFPYDVEFPKKPNSKEENSDG